MNELQVSLCTKDKATAEEVKCCLKQLEVVFTLAAVVVGIGGRGSHLQGQAVGPLERVAVPDQEGSRLSLLQSSDCCSETQPRKFIQ